MGRHTKAFAEVLAQFHLAALRMRQFEDWAKVQPDDVKRILFRQWWTKASAAEAAGQYVPSFPRYLRGLTCGARKKNGERCGSTTLCANGRCKFHGGASTGPRTAEGRERALRNLTLGRLKRGDS
ncbi:HGGxSTG domain-containing protein [Novosphingobium sp. PASSN1]|uniref:HGGxSTG domain-containing protein n=1 Tax=Novosphingobium sp. PASSN1 TaxID=2015561 RepID=UPI003455F6C7